MEPATFFAASRVVIVAGKGGVGKTTVTAALARAASLEGRSALIVEVEGKAGLPALFGAEDLGYDEDVLVSGDEEAGIGEVRARAVTADEALLEYLHDNRMTRVAKRLVSTGVLDVLATAAPGIRDILILGKVKQLENDEAADLIVLDAPAAGHAITFLRSARALQDSVRVGPINHQARDVLALLQDPTRCQVLLVTLPEETPVNELVETAYSLEEDVGVALGPVIVNGLYPPVHGLDASPGDAAEAAGLAVDEAELEALREAADFRRHRMALQAEQVDRLSDKLPLPQLHLPFLFTADLSPEDLDGLAQRLIAGVRELDPGALDPAIDEPEDGRMSAPHEGGDEPTGADDPGPDATDTERRPDPPTSIGELVDTAGIMICAGSGGVGKTTTAAVLAMEAARRGRRAVVVTIDPARRLADALGLDELGNEPGAIPGDWDGELSALMLDTKTTFDDLVTKYAADADQVERILDNRFYRNISSALSATQEFMAMEKLYALHEEADFDLIVVDTPPTRNALDFLDAPGTLTRFLDHPLYRVLMAPTRGIVKAMNYAAQALLRTASRIVGSEVIEDVLGFFQAFEGMEEGFRARASKVDELLEADGTHFVLVASPRRDTIVEAAFFADQLSSAQVPISALVVNRMHPRFGSGNPAADRLRAEELGETDLGGLYANLADFDLVARREEEHLVDLAARVEPAPVVRVPFLRSDVHDIAGLEDLAAHMVPPN